MPSISYDDFMREELADPRIAAEYLKAAADFDDPDRFAEAFQTVARLNPTFAYEMVHHIAARYATKTIIVPEKRDKKLIVRNVSKPRVAAGAHSG